MKQDKIKSLEGGNYLSFSTRRKSGEFVATPVWFAPDGDSYYLFSAGNAGKVKRLRNFSEARIAACTASGRLTGDWLETKAWLLEKPADNARALKALRRKYGWQMAIGDCFASLTGRMGRRQYIRVERPGE
ncbi:MAG: PPOX class F420-dependent oxidoreductase [Pseudomonadales bacterium]|nr:PPOX class F420-dependent oxidoreductase [Halioglobus sp.]MCP5122977.1 PPOX class F420-dependent oxidoreductase [Pseudomonadales bacterium]